MGLQNTRARLRQPLSNGSVGGRESTKNLLGFVSLVGETSRVASVTKYTSPVFQLKPGYSTIWRGYRRDYQLLAHLSFFRQRRLTNYFLAFRRVRGLAVLHNLELSLLAVLRASKFFLSDHAAMLNLTLGGVWLNGARVSYPHTQLYAGDCVQLRVDSGVYWRYKADFDFVELQRSRFVSKALRYFSFLGKGASLSYQPRAAWLVSKWLTRLGFMSLDVPGYLEVDYMATTIFLLYYPASVAELNIIAYERIPVFAVRMYN